MKDDDALLREALRIRLVEEKIVELYPTDLIQSPVHLSIGQEAVAVGVCSALSPDDLVFPNYRGHSLYLARGGDLRSFFAELMGRQTGLSKGKAGSMHLADPARGMMGASAVVASTISHAAGAALAERMKTSGKSDRVFVAVFGDGALEQGVFFETLNFVSLHSLPVLFLMEDNALAVHAALSERQAFSISEVCAAFGVSYFEENEGFDPMAVKRTTALALGHVRAASRPVFLRVKTMRYKEHVGPGDDFSAGYRSLSEVETWKAKDPLETLTFLSPAELSAINQEIERAVEFAIQSPLPDGDELLTDVL